MTKFVCPECTQRELVEHCPQCNWLRCMGCLVTISPHNTVLASRTQKQQEEVKKRRNGV